LDLFLGFGKEPVIDTSRIPSHYRNAKTHVSEDDKLQYIQEHVQKQSAGFSHLTSETIKHALVKMRNHIDINLEQWTVEHFVTTTRETLDVLFEELLEDDDDELWTSVSAIRRVLLGPMNICEYKNILTTQIRQLREKGKSRTRIIDHLSTIERRITLFPGCLHSLTTVPFNQEDFDALKRELFFRNCAGDPELKPFMFDNVVRRCCTPLLLCMPIDVVLGVSMLNPFMNNDIGFLKVPECDQQWGFFVLDKIHDDGARLWVLDNSLSTFSYQMTTSLLKYITSIFRTFYKEHFRTNTYVTDFFNKTRHNDTFITMVNSIRFIASERFVPFLQMLIMNKSFLIPTERDFFNQLRPAGKPTLVKTHLKDTLKALFDGPVDYSNIETIPSH
jgi:hypothetical protein